MKDNLPDLSKIIIEGHNFEKYLNNEIEGVDVHYNNLCRPESPTDPFKATAQIYTDRLNSVLEGGRLLAKERFPNDQELKTVFQDTKKINSIKKDLFNKDPGNKKEHEQALEIIGNLTREIAVSLKQAEERSYMASEGDMSLETDWIKTLQHREYQKISTTPRKTIINVYPDGDGGYMISYAKPITTISSLSREGERLNEGEPIKLPNFWKSISIHVDKEGKELSRRTLFRSSSLSPSAEKNKKERLKKAEEIAKFEMGEYVLDKLKEKINNNSGDDSIHGYNLSDEQISSCFQFDFLSMSLQSSIFTEAKSVREASRIYEKITQQGRQGGFELLDYHKEEIRKLGIQNINAYPTKVKPNIVFFNLGCNALRGNDFTGIQGTLNKKAKRALQVKVQDSLNNKDNKDIADIKAILLRKNPVGNKEIKAIENKLKEPNSSIDPKTKETIDLFLNFCYLNKGKQNLSFVDQIGNGSIDNYLKQESVMALAENLGFVVKGNCQSGKDRTGLLFAMTEATQIYRDRLDTNNDKRNIIKDKKIIWEDLLPNTTKKTSGRVIVNMNCPGANGLQGQVYNVITPPGFKESIDALRQHRASKLHKAPYGGHKEKIFNDKKLLENEKNTIKQNHIHEIHNTNNSPAIKSTEFKEQSPTLNIRVKNNSPNSPNSPHSIRARQPANSVLNAFQQHKSPTQYFETLKSSFRETNWIVKNKQRNEIELSNSAHNEGIKFNYTHDSFDVATQSTNKDVASALYKAAAAVSAGDNDSSYEVSMTSEYNWEDQLEIMYRSGLDLNKISSLKVDGKDYTREVKEKILQIQNKDPQQANTSTLPPNNTRMKA